MNGVVTHVQSGEIWSSTFFVSGQLRSLSPNNIVSQTRTHVTLTLFPTHYLSQLQFPEQKSTTELFTFSNLLSFYKKTYNKEQKFIFADTVKWQCHLLILFLQTHSYEIICIHIMQVHMHLMSTDLLVLSCICHADMM